MHTGLFSELIDTSGKSPQAITISGTQGLGIAYLAAKLSQFKPIILVTRDTEQVDNILRDTRFFFGANHREHVWHLPHNDRTPYHSTSPDPAIIMERAATLNHIATGKPFRLLILSPEALITRVIPFAEQQRMTELLEKNMDIDREGFIRYLNQAGYSQTTVVEDPGTYAVRGSILDIFWPGNPKPIRVDFFGNTIESIKTFDPQTQRTIATHEEISLGPIKDIFLTEAVVPASKQRLRDLADEVNFPTKALNEKLIDLDNHIPFFGIENLLPAFHTHLETPLEFIEHIYKRCDIRIVLDSPDSIRDSVNAMRSTYESLYTQALAKSQLCYAPNHYVSNYAEIEERLSGNGCIRLSSFGDSALTFETRSTDDLRSEILVESTRTDDLHGTAIHEGHLLQPLAKRIRALRADNYLVFLPQSTQGGVRNICELLSGNGIHVKPLATAPDWFLGVDSDLLSNPSIHAFSFVAHPESPASGALLHDSKIAIYAEDDIFGKRARKQGDLSKKRGFTTQLADIAPGDCIVHVDHGVGVFKGLTRLNLRGTEQDYLLLTYADEDKLYLPVHRINLIQKYAGVDTDTPKLDKLGGQGWQTKKTKVKEAVMAMAQELLRLYAKREVASRTPFNAPDTLYWEFESRFGFETTPDQQKAIDDVLRDMQTEKPMDRLICGDVGYGKTEVAMRAAMLALVAGKQVAVLAPTTILAQQHGMTFGERFAQTGAHVGVVSRFQSTKEINETLQKAKSGQLDILIGTHRLLSSDVSFKNLGLVIVDEEQRFGIKAKEHLKKLRTQADFLTLSATPIPRTLQMGLLGLRDLSIIETPPVDRRAIRTSVLRFDDDVIRESIMRELNRGGQVYFVHNRVMSIGAIADYLKSLVPEAKIQIGHGQMDEEALEDTMMRFIRHEFNVLVCTTIIETGIDVPSANTMFINNADDFGLSQLYQLRGRIGRSKERAFAYLVVPETAEQLTPVARRRLEILQQFSELGVGFRIAQHDLELRGAGDLLGQKQHGQVAAVGYDLYTELLKEAAENLRGQIHEDVPDPEINIPMSALIPDSYAEDLQERLGFYQKLATAQTDDGVFDVIAEMQDLLGQAPQEVHTLGEVMILKQKLRTFAARGLDLQVPATDPYPRIIISLGDNARLDPAKLSTWITARSKGASLTPKMKLIITATQVEWERNAQRNFMMLCQNLVADLMRSCGVTSN